MPLLGPSLLPASTITYASSDANLVPCPNAMQVINEMAAQTLVLNMDRCTKNFYVYREPGTQRW